MDTKPAIEIDWWPQPRQLACLAACGLAQPFTGEELTPAIADVIGYGGAAGGGKTDTLLQVALVAGVKYPKLNIAYFRREFPQLEGLGGAISRSKQLFSHFTRYNEQKHKWSLPTGSNIQFFHCKDPNDVFNYQSQQFDILLIDEVTQFTKEMVKYLLGRNRATVKYPTFKPFAVFATNPGNVGHSYFKEEFVTIGEPEKVNLFLNEVGQEERHIFIPSKLDDNQVLVDRDPGYANRVGNTEMNRKILLEGSWDVFAGQAFGELSREVHLIPPFEIPDRWKKFAAYDHGFNHPFSFGVFAINDDGEIFLFRHAKNRLKRVDEIADTIKSLTALEGFTSIYAGHDCWSTQRDGGPTISEQFIRLGIVLQKANIDRIQGASHVRQFVAWKGTQTDSKGAKINGKPRFYIFNQYQDVYNTLSQMIFDPNRPEDVLKIDADENGIGGDDDYDMVRYGLMSRPRPLPQKAVLPPPNSFDALLRKKREQREARGEYVGY